MLRDPIKPNRKLSYDERLEAMIKRIEALIDWSDKSIARQKKRKPKG